MNALSKVAFGSVAAFLMAAAAAQASDTKEVHKTLALERDGRVAIHTYKGSITITTWDRPEVRVDAVIEPDGDCRDMREKVQRTQVRIAGGGGTVDITSDYEDAKRHSHGFFFGWFDGDTGTLPFVRYTIQMPATARLEIEDYKSEITVSDLKNDFRLKTYKGIARVANLDGAARVETHKGDVRVAFARFSKASRFETYKGEIDLRVPRDSHFDLDADAGRRGDIDTDFATMARARRSRGSDASGAVNGGGPELRMTTHKGTLRIRASS